MNTYAGTPHKDRVEFLDGLRGWAAVGVFFFHLLVKFMAVENPELHPWYLRFVLDGHLAVLVFFVISGYALSHGNLDPSKRDLELTAAARYFRLAIPIAATSFIAYAVMKLGLMHNLRTAAEGEGFRGWLGNFYSFDASLYSLAKFSLYEAFFAYDGRTSYNSSLWTIPYEIVGSFAVYGYLAIFRRTDSVRWLVALAAFAVTLLSMPLIACFFAGYLIAEANARFRIPKEWRWVVELVAVLAFIAAAIISTSLRPGNDRYTCLVAAMIVLAVSRSDILKGFFSNAASRFLGRISFPLYLIHIVVICSWSSWLYAALPRSGFDNATALAINIATTFAITVASSWALLPLERFSVQASKEIAKAVLGRYGTPAKCTRKALAALASPGRDTVRTR